MTKIRVLIADDHPLILESLAILLSEEEGLEFAAQASSGDEVISILRDYSIELAILDLSMPGKSGLDCMEIIHKEFPDLKVMFLTVHQEAYVVKQLIAMGAKGFLLKNAGLDKIRDAIRLVASGETYFQDINLKRNLNSEEIHLTNREKEIIRLVVKGHSSSEIAEMLFISQLTVKTHRKNILKKLGFSNTAQLASFAMSSGIIPPDD